MTTLTDTAKTETESSRGDRSPRLLLIAYNFPPVGGAGVQRPVKWVKYLRRLGWDVTVLTTENPSVPARDESLLADIPDDVLIKRARTWEPGYETKLGLVQQKTANRGIVSRVKSGVRQLAKSAVKLALQPDPQVLWVPNAIRAGQQALRALNHDAILVTAPAYSSFFIGTRLKRQFGLPLVLDFRDEWDLSGQYLENAQRDWISTSVQRWMQRSVLRQADAVIATTKASSANLRTKLTAAGRVSTPTATIYNGFDEDEFHPATSLESASSCPTGDDSHRPVAGRFRLLYTGTLWNLTTIEPLIDAALRLNESNPQLLSKLELVCVGRKTPEQVAIVQRLQNTDCKLTLIDYCAHSQILDWLQSADAVCLLLSDVAGAERVVPAKLFEYLATRKDMLAIVPTGETAQIVHQFFPEGSIEPKNIQQIADWLKARLLAADQVAAPRPANSELQEYSRATQSERLVELLNSLVTLQSGTRRQSR